MKYIANPVTVDAYRIDGVGDPLENGSRVLRFTAGHRFGGCTRVAPPEMLASMTPLVGDYWVEQPDGIAYLYSKYVFEQSYRAADRIPENDCRLVILAFQGDPLKEGDEFCVMAKGGGHIRPFANSTALIEGADIDRIGRDDLITLYVVPAAVPLIDRIKDRQ